MIAFYNVDSEVKSDSAVLTACRVDEFNAFFFLILIVCRGSALYPPCMENHRIGKKMNRMEILSREHANLIFRHDLVCMHL
jgi:hypothetical protein